MKIEEKLGETMKRATADEPLPRDVWNAFERRARRSQRVRYVSAGVALAVIVALAAVAIPRIGGDRDQGFAGSGKEIGIARPDGWSTRTDVVADYAIAFPSEWIATGNLPYTQLQPKALGVGDASFLVKLSVLHNLTLTQSLRGGTVHGHPFVRTERPGDARSKLSMSIQYLIQWSRDEWIAISIESPNRDRAVFQRYLRAAERIVSTLDECTCAHEWRTHADSAQSVRLLYPRSWRQETRRGSVQFQPSVSPPGATFSVSYRTLPISFSADETACANAGSECSVGSGELFDGRRYVQVNTPLTGGGMRETFKIEWAVFPGGCPRTGCPGGPALEVTVVSSSAQLSDQYHDVEQQILYSIEHS